MAVNASIPTRSEVLYWFSRAGFVSVVALGLLLLIGHLGISRLVAPVSPLTAKVQAVAEQAIRAQNIALIAQELSQAKRPGRLYTFRTELAAELNEFAAVHKALVLGDPGRGLTGGYSAAAKEILTEPDTGLDRFARDFEARIRRDFLSNSLTVDASLSEGLGQELRQNLSPRLAALAAQLSVDARSRVSLIFASLACLLSLSIVLLLLTSRMLYRPIAQTLIGALQERASQNSEEHLRYDEVTGLANRAHLQSHLAELCGFARQHQLRSAVLDIELSGIEDVRRSMDLGDFNEMMSMIARRIESVCRSGDFIARVNDCEFVVILVNIEDDSTLSDITNALRTKLALPFLLAQQRFSFKTKMGIKIADSKDQVPATILNQAGTALKVAKASESYDIQFFSGTIAPRASAREREFRRISKGLNEGEFTAFFQPIVDLKTEALVGLEALARWQHPKQGLLSPIHFMETIENRGLFNELTRAVLGESFRAMRDWQSNGIDVPFVSVNLSLDQLQDRGFIDELKWIADSYERSPSAIIIECPERAFHATAEAPLRANLARMSSYGFRLMLEDFGSSGSDLPDLKGINVEYIKIKRAFVSNVATEPHQQDTLAHLIGQAHKANCPVIAEGVETPAERSALDRLKAEAIQGFLIREAMERDRLTEWATMEERNRTLQVKAS